MPTTPTARRPSRAALAATVCTVALLVADRLLERGGDRLLLALGVAALALAAVFIAAPFYYLKKRGSVPAGRPFYETTGLVDVGVYALVRHPQYLGYCLLAAGFALSSQRLPVVGLAVLAVAGFYAQAVAEERCCRDRFGPPYERYLREVPRFNLPLGILRWAARRARGASRDRPPSA